MDPFNTIINIYHTAAQVVAFQPVTILLAMLSLYVMLKLAYFTLTRI